MSRTLKCDFHLKVSCNFIDILYYRIVRLLLKRRAFSMGRLSLVNSVHLSLRLYKIPRACEYRPLLSLSKTYSTGTVRDGFRSDNNETPPPHRVAYQVRCHSDKVPQYGTESQVLSLVLFGSKAQCYSTKVLGHYAQRKSMATSNLQRPDSCS